MARGPRREVTLPDRDIDQLTVHALDGADLGRLAARQVDRIQRAACDQIRGVLALGLVVDVHHRIGQAGNTHRAARLENAVIGRALQHQRAGAAVDMEQLGALGAFGRVGIGAGGNRGLLALVGVGGIVVQRLVDRCRAIVNIDAQALAIGADDAQPIGGRVEVDDRARAERHFLRQRAAGRGLAAHMIDDDELPGRGQAVELAVGRPHVDADDLVGARNHHWRRGDHGGGIDLDQLVVGGEADQGRGLCGRRTHGEYQQRHTDEICESVPGSHSISSSCVSCLRRGEITFRMTRLTRS